MRVNDVFFVCLLLLLLARAPCLLSRLTVCHFAPLPIAVLGLVHDWEGSKDPLVKHSRWLGLIGREKTAHSVTSAGYHLSFLRQWADGLENSVIVVAVCARLELQGNCLAVPSATTTLFVAIAPVGPCLGVLLGLTTALIEPSQFLLGWAERIRGPLKIRVVGVTDWPLCPPPRFIPLLSNHWAVPNPSYDIAKLYGDHAASFGC